MGGNTMSEKYISPKAEVVEFDTKDVITTSPDNNFSADTSGSANKGEGWSGLY